jgi:hypothetical protein
VPYKEKEARVLELIEDVGLDGKEDQRVGVRGLLFYGCALCVGGCGRWGGWGEGVGGGVRVC